MAIRKSVTALTTQEKDDFIAAVKTLKTTRRNAGDPLTIYDTYVDLHANNRGGAHGGPAFLPWHREYILRFELDIQEAIPNPNFGLPYWDWAADAQLNDPTDPLLAPTWRNNFMGGDGNPVSRGPFIPSQWRTTDGDGTLKRGFGDRANMGTQAEVNSTVSVVPYDQAPFHDRSDTVQPTFRKQLEGFVGTNSGLHNGMHGWVGGPNGQMSFVMISPNDPVFWLHHCNVDRIWAHWDACQPNSVSRYDPSSGANPGHNRGEAMIPFNDPVWAHPRRPQNINPEDVLDINALRDTAGGDISYSYDTFHRRFVTLRRTTGNRFVSDQVIEVSASCSTQNDTSTRIFLPTSSGGSIRARFVRVEPGANPGDVAEVETIEDEVSVQ